MSFLPWLLLAALGVAVVWVVMKQNSPLPPPPATTPYGQPYPLSGGANFPSSQSADAATATAIGNAVAAGFNLVGNIIASANSK